MPAIMIITCPSCSKQSKGPAELSGKKLRCKACGHTFVVGKPPAAKAKSGVKHAEEEPPVVALAETVVDEGANAQAPPVLAVAEEADAPNRSKPSSRRARTDKPVRASPV